MRAALHARALDLEEPPPDSTAGAQQEGEQDEEGEEGVESVEAEVETILGRRWAKNGERTVDYLVKWRGRSHLHVVWRSGSSLAKLSEKAAAKVKLYSRNAQSLPPFKGTAAKASYFNEAGKLNGKGVDG